MGCILQDLFTKVNILLQKKQCGHPLDPAIYLLRNSLSKGVCISMKQVHLASLLTFWKLKPGIPSYPGPMWIHMVSASETCWYDKCGIVLNDKIGRLALWKILRASGFQKKHKHTRLRCGGFRQTVLFVSWVFCPKNRTRCGWRAFGDWRILLSKLEAKWI